MRVISACDKFRGTATAADVSNTVRAVALELGWEAESIPLSDGGEGLIDLFGGPNRHTVVTSPLGAPVSAGWYLRDGLAVIESALASGLALVGGAASNRPVDATSRGTGELIVAAVRQGARRVVVGLGGSAMSDGGTGALDALGLVQAQLSSGLVQLQVCCDVETFYVDAARVFGPQKGATPGEVTRLSDRLALYRYQLLKTYGFDPQSVRGGGAAGGLAGALACVGGELVSGFDFMAEHTGLDKAMRSADLVVTGEGQLDATSLQGKVVGGVAKLAHQYGVRMVAVVGAVADDLAVPFEAISLTERFGREYAYTHTLSGVRQVTSEVLTRPLA